MVNRNRWSGEVVAQARAYMAEQLPADCARCGLPIDNQPWVVGHKKSRLAYPELQMDPTNWQHEHKRCSDASASDAIRERAAREALLAAGHDRDQVDAMVEALMTSQHPSNNGKGDRRVKDLYNPVKVDANWDTETKTAGQAPSFSGTAPDLRQPAIDSLSPVSGTCGKQVGDIGNESPATSWEAFVSSAPAWFPADLLTVPEDAAPPRAISPIPAEAVGSYGPELIEWARESHGITLRWWQQLATVCQLAHDAAGALVFDSVVDSAPRRSGKSVRLRMVALWRLMQSDRFGEEQLVMHTGKDMSIVREIQRAAWRWCDEHEWTVMRANGKEAIEHPDGSRWLARAQDAVYGYDVCLALVDEAWGVKPDSIAEGLEPATLERSSPQVHLTSTAHVRATSLMRKRLQSALNGAPGTLILLWGADPEDDPADPVTWRKASAHWSLARERMIRQKYEEALAGEQSPEFDNMAPMDGFTAQYLNVWPGASLKGVGDPIVSPGGWQALYDPLTGEYGAATACAVESWHGESVAVAYAGETDDGRIWVSVDLVENIATAAVEVSRQFDGTTVHVGKTYADDPAWGENSIVTQARSGTVVQAVAGIAGAIRDGRIVHDSETGAPLTEQILKVRTAPTADGFTIKSRYRADAIKAAHWAYQAALAEQAKSPAVYVG